MGGAFSKKKDKPPERQNPSDARNRRLSVTGDKQQFPSGDRNEEGQVSDRGINDYIRFSALSNAGYEPDGHKKTNQDAFVSIPEHGDPSVSLFAVFDGHGACGHLVSGYVRREWPRHIDMNLVRQEVANPTEKAEAVLRNLKESFERVNNNLERDKSVDSSLSGTTAVGCILLGKGPNRRIICGNAGDSRAILCYKEGSQLKVKELSDDQKPDREDERHRIIQCGGRVEPLIDENGEPIGPHRVWLPNMMLPGLAMARSIGDDIAATVGVHATPEILVHNIKDNDQFVVICSDGVWEFLSNEEVVDIVRSCDGDADRACKELCARSYREWKAEEEVVDDITALVIYLTGS